MSTAQALSVPQGLSMPMTHKIFAFASMCVGMFIALIDIQIVSRLAAGYRRRPLGGRR